MSILDELQQAAAKHDPLDEIHAHVQALRDQAKAAFNAQFVMGSENVEKTASLKGRLEAFDECLQLFDRETNRTGPQGSRQWADEE